MDILIPFLVGLTAAGIIWTVATVLEKKQAKKKEQAIADNEDLYEED